MTVLRCTQKLLAELRVKPGLDTDPDETGWHANLLRIERRKCVLFTQDETLFSFLLCGLTRPDFEHFPHLFGQGLFKAMLQSGFDADRIEPMLETTPTRVFLEFPTDLAFFASARCPMIHMFRIYERFQTDITRNAEELRQVTTFEPEKLTFETRDEFHRKSIAEKTITLLLSGVDISPMVIDGKWGTGKSEFCSKLINLLTETFTLAFQFGEIALEQIGNRAGRRFDCPLTVYLFEPLALALLGLVPLDQRVLPRALQRPRPASGVWDYAKPRRQS